MATHHSICPGFEYGPIKKLAHSAERVKSPLVNRANAEENPDYCGCTMTSLTPNDNIPANWAQPLVDQNAFEAEQVRLRHIWTFLGLTRDLAKDGDWFRTTIATRSVFVQRFGDEFKGFENRCAHRFYPLRKSDKGCGPVVCGFHHWRYDRNGRAVGIPKCEELFGKSPRELDAKLSPIELATCGAFIFGRFPTPAASDSLEQYLGDGFPILETMSRMPVAPHESNAPVQANWRLCCHITHDDYHQVAVHPNTFGKNGYPSREAMGYFRFGLHSGFLSTPDPAAFSNMVAACRDGSFGSSYYFILQIFPNLIISHGRSDGQFWHILVQQYLPIAHDRTLLRSWRYPSPLPADHAWHVRWTRPLTDPWRALAVRYVVGKIRNEDHAVCERLQKISGQIDRAPVLGALEERIAWFEESYAKVMASGNELPVRIQNEKRPGAY
jgi:phenylpropionate dioxygenase-like ring-hydroxylating dioxygenase large terminal subunit